MVKQSRTNADGALPGPKEQPTTPSGSQTLLRGLDVIEAISHGRLALPELAGTLGLTRSTSHRLASVLCERGYLKFSPREGYTLGPKLLELGYLAQQALDIPRLARPHIEELSFQTDDTVHLGVLDGGEALYMDKIPGRRRVEISSRVGERQPLTSTGLGKALILDMSEEDWRLQYQAENAKHPNDEGAYQQWLTRMRAYAAGGYAFDLEENEDQIRCVAAPVRDMAGRVVASISLSSAAQYMDDQRMAELRAKVRGTAEAISRELGWSETSLATQPKKRK